MFTADDARQLATQVQEARRRAANPTPEEAADAIFAVIEQEVLVDPSTTLILYYGPFPEGTRELLQEAGYKVKPHMTHDERGFRYSDGVRITWPPAAEVK